MYPEKQQPLLVRGVGLSETPDESVSVAAELYREAVPRLSTELTISEIEVKDEWALVASIFEKQGEEEAG